MVLTRAQARAYYDRFGSKQDSQAFYEDAPIRDMIAHADLGSVQHLFEFGCGTGRLAAELLAEYLPPEVKYTGSDLSATMVGLARGRLAAFGERAEVIQSEGAIMFPVADHSVNCVVSTYVLDLLSPADVEAVFSESRRVLADGGRLCLVSLTTGQGVWTKLVSGLWSVVYRIWAPVVGGCRPIRLLPYVEEQGWSLAYRNVVSRWGISSEVVVARVTEASG